MFESPDETPATPSAEVVQDSGVPVEFSYRGRVFRISSLLARWKETSPWWKHLGSQQGLVEVEEKILWSVEAAPIGAVNTFEIEFNQTTNTWHVRPTSRSN